MTQHLTEALRAKKIHPTDFSIRELAEAYMGREWVESLHPKHGMARPVLEADGAAVALSDFGNITGQIFFNTVKEAYDNEEFVFSKLVPTRPSTIIDSMEKIPGISGVGDEFSVIGEGGEYPNFGVSEDYQEISVKQKRGGLVPVTKEAVLGDRTGVLLDRAKSVGFYLGLNREKRIIDALIDENAGAKSAALGGHRYHWRGTTYATHQATTPWVNVVSSNALASWVSVESAWLKLAAIVDPFTQEPILIKPTHLVVTPQLEATAWRILHTTNVQTHFGGYATSGTLQDQHAPSPVAAVFGNLQIASSRLLAARAATDTDWWLSNPSKQCAYFSIWDVLTEEAPANNREMFHRDIVHIVKVSEMGCAATIEPRCTCESNA